MPKISEDYSRIVVYVPRSDQTIHEALRRLAYERKMTISAIATEYIRQGLEREKEETK